MHYCSNESPWKSPMEFRLRGSCFVGMAVIRNCAVYLVFGSRGVTSFTVMEFIHSLHLFLSFRTYREWHSALVVKRVCFECFDCFMPLLYIAFYQLDVVTLRAEIVSLFMSKINNHKCPK